MIGACGAVTLSELTMCRFVSGQKLRQSEIEAAMNEMDEDGKRQNEMLQQRQHETESNGLCAGSGEVDFEEFYDWWTSDKASSVIKKSQGDQKDFEIEPH